MTSSAYDSRLKPVIDFILRNTPYGFDQIISFSLAEMSRAMLEEALMDNEHTSNEAAVHALVAVCDAVSQDNQNPKTECPIKRCEAAKVATP